MDWAKSQMFTIMMKKNLFLICFIISLLFSIDSWAFKFDQWTSGMSLKEVVKIAQKEDITLYKNAAAVTQEGIDPIARLLLNRKIDFTDLEDVNQVSYGIHLLNKWASVTLTFTPKTKQLSSVNVLWTEFSLSGLKERRFDPAFVEIVKPTLIKKYGKPIEQSDDSAELTLFKKISWQWRLDENETITMTSDFKSLRLIYENTEILLIAEKERKMIEEQRVAEERRKKQLDKQKF